MHPLFFRSSLSGRLHHFQLDAFRDDELDIKKTGPEFRARSPDSDEWYREVGRSLCGWSRIPDTVKKFTVPLTR
jgi:hypothetical protein